MKRIIFTSLLLLVSLSLLSHPWKPNHYVIIDTDGGIDDIRAITLLLASPDVRVLAITVSPGALSADNAYIKVKSLLNSFYHEGILVGINRTDVFRSQNFETAKNYKWGNEEGIAPEKAPDFIDVIKEILAIEKTKISFVCLGGMTTASSALKEIPDFKTQVREIIWSCNGLKETNGFNYNIDKSSARKILNQTLPVKAVTGYDGVDFFDYELTGRIGKINTPYAKKIFEFLSSEPVKGHPFSGKANDEMVSLFIHFPELFNITVSGNNSESIPSDIPSLKKGIIKILKGETVARNQVVKVIPVDPSFYFADIEPSVTEIINKYGQDEWSSGVLANELHRHLGVFAIIGVKMGIRAREYFDTGVDEFRATTFAGSVPPLSCMNDGIQVSTGATPGHGLLTVSTDTLTKPSAEFTYLDNRIRLTLKPEYAKKISEELKEINFVYGLDSNIYWELVRKNTIKYWLTLDRHEIFNIEILK
jgi:formylmethanofuran dehydrogenase subunit E